ncbi:MAG TPA: hypothetical protein VFG88_10615 [Nocardioidaceae bacterium]|nr:hypothetical protein [Nocardioidaceae bacterium]
MNAQERIARANRIAADAHGRNTSHCDDCGQLHCSCPTIPEQRTGAHDEQTMDTLVERLTWEQAAR